MEELKTWQDNFWYNIRLCTLMSTIAASGLGFGTCQKVDEELGSMTREQRINESRAYLEEYEHKNIFYKIANFDLYCASKINEF